MLPVMNSEPDGAGDGFSDVPEDMVYEEVTVNLSGLDEELRAALGSDAIGASLSEGRLRVHVRRGTARDRVDAVIAAHRPERLTVVQQAARDRAEALVQLDKPWADWTAADKDRLLRLLSMQLGLTLARRADQSEM